MTGEIIYSSEPEDFYYVGANIPCQNACPAHTNIPAYIRSVFDKNYDASYEINRRSNILPAVLGRICSRPCEDKCRHGEHELGTPVNICHIKRAAADYKQQEVTSRPSLSPIGKHVAVIGAGPSGLAAAHDLAYCGFSVTVFEAMDEPGGMLMYGIPEFRLPRNILKEELNTILGLGITLKTGIRVGQDIHVEQLLQDYDGVLVATGCFQPISLDIPGETLTGVYSGLEFMIQVCSGKKPTIGHRVLVIGAGFTAFDCARSALRLGAEEVTICLRRTQEDLRVTHDEILETKAEGITIRSLMISRQILGEKQVAGVEFLRTHPGGLHPDGKKMIMPIEGSEFVLEADTVIIAAGQMPGPFEIPTKTDNKQVSLITESDSFRISITGLYATGDYLTGPTTVIESIALGRKAAQQIALDLAEKKIIEEVVRLEETSMTDRKRTWDFIPRQEMPTVDPLQDRFKSIAVEVEKGYDKTHAHTEAQRCYLCYLHYEIDVDRCIYCRYCIDVAPRDCIKLVNKVKTNQEGAIIGFDETTVWKDVNAVIIDNSRCIRCGDCVKVCPVDCISVTRVELVEKDRDQG